MPKQGEPGDSLFVRGTISVPLNTLQMAIYALSDVSGLTEWIDYIPVQQETSGRAGSTDDDGYLQSVEVLSDDTGLVAWRDYIPVYEVTGRTKPWSTDADGYIPYDEIGSVAAWSPLALFASGEVGAWYDPSDLTTMWTDDGVTQAVLEDLVYRIDDKSGNGNHAYQTTAASRPIIRALYNILPTINASYASEDLSWCSGSANVVYAANQAVAPDGTTTADQVTDVGGGGTATNVQFNTTYNMPAAGQYTHSIFLKRADGKSPRWVYIGQSGWTSPSASGFWVNLADGSTSGTPSGFDDYGIEDYGSGWYRVWMTFTISTDIGGSINWRLTDSDSATSCTLDGTNSLYAWGWQVNHGTLLPYQKVTSATDYVTSSTTETYDFPYYLEFDGTDDYLETANYTITGPDQWVMVAWQPDDLLAASGVYARGSITADESASRLNAPNTASAITRWHSYYGGTSVYSGSTSGTTAEQTDIQEMTMESGVGHLYYVSGTLRDSNDTIGTLGTPASIPTTLGAGANGGGLYGDGRIYQFVHIDRLPTGTDQADLRTFVADKSGVTLP